MGRFSPSNGRSVIEGSGKRWNNYDMGWNNCFYLVFGDIGIDVCDEDYESHGWEIKIYFFKKL
jgi:hypothetical protein